MKYDFNGKMLSIPDKELATLMKSLDLTKEQAIEVWLDDHDFVKNEEAEAMTQKAKSVPRRYEKSDKERKPRTRPPKVDEVKAPLLEAAMKAMVDYGVTVTEVVNQANFSFTYKGLSFTIKLIKHNTPK